MADSNFSNLRKLLKLDACFRNPNPERCTYKSINDALVRDGVIDKGMSRSAFYAHVNNFQTMGAEFVGHKGDKNEDTFIFGRTGDGGKTAYFQYTDLRCSIPALSEMIGEVRKDSGLELLELLEKGEGAQDSVHVWLRLFLHRMLKGDVDTSLDVVSFYDNLNLMADNLKKFETILEAILNHQPLEIEYAYGKHPKVLIMPCILKNYNQRWYLVGKRWNDDKRPDHPEDYYEGYTNIALNGIQSIKPWNDQEWIEPDWEELKEYYDEIVGVTPSTEGPQDVYLRFDKDRYEKYVATKPIVATQKLVKEGSEYFDPEHHTLKLIVHITKELTQQILSFGPDVEVLAPDSLRQEIKEKIAAMAAKY